jgi:predicted peptidase
MVTMFAVFLASASTHGRQSAPEGAEGTAMYEHGTVELETGEGAKRSFGYRLMRPASEAGNGPLPLVIFLHGAGERGSDNERQLTYLPRWMASSDHREKHPCFLLAVQCPLEEFWAPYERGEGKAPIPGPPTEPLLAVERAIDALLATEAIDPERIYLTGLSMGGFGTWTLASRHPERFAAVVPICGGGDAASAGKLVDIPIWVVHGTSDRVVPERLSREMVDAIKAAGGTVRYSALEGVAHDSWTPAYNRLEVISWMFKQRLESAPDDGQ